MSIGATVILVLVGLYILGFIVEGLINRVKASIASSKNQKLVSTHNTPGSEYEEIDEESCQWATYTNHTYGYSIDHPTTTSVTEKDYTAHSDMLMDHTLNIDIANHGDISVSVLKGSSSAETFAQTVEELIGHFTNPRFKSIPSPTVDSKRKLINNDLPSWEVVYMQNIGKLIMAGPQTYEDLYFPYEDEGPRSGPLPWVTEAKSRVNMFKSLYVLHNSRVYEVQIAAYSVSKGDLSDQVLNRIFNSFHFIFIER